MGPKRKRADAGPVKPPVTEVPLPVQIDGHGHRATRQTPVQPPAIPPIPSFSSKPGPGAAGRAATTDQVPVPRVTQIAPPSLPQGQAQQQQSPPPKRGRGRPPIHKPQPPPPPPPPPRQQQQPMPPTAQPRHPVATPVQPPSPPFARWSASVTSPPSRPMPPVAVKENARMAGLPKSDATAFRPTPPSQPAKPTTVVKPPPVPFMQPKPQPAQTSSRPAKRPPPVITPVPPPKPPTLPQPEKPPSSPDRNIDKVVLGNLCFRTWYPSYYGKEVLGDTSGNARGGSKESADAKSHLKRDRDNQLLLEILYVCPSCFKYSKELVGWWTHVRLCERKCFVPGRKIYVHPKGRRKILVPNENKSGTGTKKRRTDGGSRYVEEMVQDEGEWSIWEVDGEKEGLFCQNLSLFAKLFLDNKSVFFDVTGFNYFLLVYTPPFRPSLSAGEPPQPPAPQVTGFFSKEKLSWDSNNLACILVFPPWQRKGLGALLMGVSYEISRREGVLGGPEKPISDIGRKGYKRFWAGEVARWLLSLDVDPTGKQDTIVDIVDCAEATWMLPEDCLGVLRDMGVAEDAGKGPGKPEKPRAEQQQPDNKPDGEGSSNEASEQEQKPAKIQCRVRVDKDAVRRYVVSHRINLERACDPNGFPQGYAVKADETKDEEMKDE